MSNSNTLSVTTMRSRPTTPCTPISPISENPLTRRARLLLNTNDCNSDDKYKKPTPSFHRLISQNTSTVIKCVVVVSLALNLVSIPSLFAVVFGPLWYKACSSGMGLSNAVCLPCGENGIPGVTTERTGNGYCCTTASDPNIQPLLEKKVLQVSAHHGHAFNPDCETNTSSTPDKKKHRPLTLARLILDVPKTKRERECQWLNRSPKGLAFIQGDLDLVNNSIRVTKGGIFRIRSHLSFDSINNNLHNNTRAAYILTHVVVKTSSSSSDIENMMMEKVMMEKRSYTSSDLDLTVKLHANDGLIVLVNDYQYLYNYNIANTFEIQRIT